MNLLFDPSQPLPEVQDSDLQSSRVLDLTRCQFRHNPPFRPHIVPDESFPDPGCVIGAHYLIVTPFGSFIGSVTRYADRSLCINGVGGGHHNADVNRRDYQGAVQMAAEYGTEYVYGYYANEIVRVGTPGSRLRDKLAAELRAVEQRAEYLRETIATLGGES